MVSTVQTALSPSLLYFETVSLCGQARIKLLIPHLWLSSTRIIGISHQIWLKIFFENIIKSYLKEFLIIGPKAQMQVKIPIKRVTTLLNTKGNSQCKGLRNIPAALRQQPGSHSHFNSPSLGTGRKKKFPTTIKDLPSTWLPAFYSPTPAGRTRECSTGKTAPAQVPL